MSSRAKSWFAGLGILVSALGLVWFLAPYYATHTIWALRASLFVWGPILLLAVAGLAVILTLGWGRRIPVLITAMLGCAGALGALGLWLYHGYATDKVYAQSVVVTADADDTRQQTPPRSGNQLRTQKEREMANDEKLERMNPAMQGAWILGYAQGMGMSLGMTTGIQKPECDEIGVKAAAKYLECPERAEAVGEKLTALAEFWADRAPGVAVAELPAPKWGPDEVGCYGYGHDVGFDTKTGLVWVEDRDMEPHEAIDLAAAILAAANKAGEGKA